MKVRVVSGRSCVGVMRKNHLGQYLKIKRKEVGLTQKAVAKKLGYTSSQFVSNFERGLCSPPLKQLKKLAKMYDLDPAEIIDILILERKDLLESAFYGRKRKDSSS